MKIAFFDRYWLLVSRHSPLTSGSCTRWSAAVSLHTLIRSAVMFSHRRHVKRSSDTVVMLVSEIGKVVRLACAIKDGRRDWRIGLVE